RISVWRTRRGRPRTALRLNGVRSWCSSTSFPFVFSAGGNQWGLGTEVACAYSHGRHAPCELQRNVVVLYPTFAGGGEADQVLCPEVFFQPGHAEGDLLRRAAQGQFPAGEPGHFVEDADVG